MDDLTDGLNGTGKDLNKDDGKSTLVAMLGAEVVHQRLSEHLRSADEHLATACPRGVSTRRFMRARFDKQMTLFGESRATTLPGC